MILLRAVYEASAQRSTACWQNVFAHTDDDISFLYLCSLMTLAETRSAGDHARPAGHTSHPLFSDFAAGYKMK